MDISLVRKLAIFIGPILAVVLLLIPNPFSMSNEAWAFLAVLVWMVIWWLFEAVPIPVTSMLPIVIMPLVGIGDVKAVTSQYANPIIFLFLCGFMLAAAMQRWGLHRRIALNILSYAGSSPSFLIGGFMCSTAFLSMWISNTSATIMMFAVAMSVIEFVSAKTADQQTVRKFGIALMLGIAYSGTIGGVGTLIGTPPNALMAGFLSNQYGIQVDFLTWMKFGVPIVLVMLPIAWFVLTKVVFSFNKIQIGNIDSLINSELGKLGPMSTAEKKVAVVFFLVAIGWIIRKPLVDYSGLQINDTSIALLGVILLFTWPSGTKSKPFMLDWDIARDIPWGVLLLFGGGLAIAYAFNVTSLASWVGQQVTGIETSTWILSSIIVISIVFLTEVTSNTASTATFLPILAAVAVGLQLDPRTFVVPATVAASMAFMMPVATPPNAIVFSYEQLRLSDMVKAGIVLNLFAIIVTSLGTYWLGSWVFGI